MWNLLAETFAGVLGVTKSRPKIAPLAYVVSLVWLTSIAFAQRSPAGFFALTALVLLTVAPAVQVLRARSALWRAARWPTTDPRHRPENDGRDLPPTARSLQSLAAALAAARRGSFIDAAHTLDLVDPDRLAPPELRLFEATRALVSLGMDDLRRAAAQATRALPTGSDDLDIQLGRALVSEAWSDATRLRSIDEAWASEGVGTGPRAALPRLRALVRLRIDTAAIEGIEPWEAKTLADEARAIGDEALAVDLESRGRPAAYR